MIYNLILTLILIDSLLPTIAVIRGYWFGKYAILNNLNYNSLVSVLTVPEIAPTIPTNCFSIVNFSSA